MTRDEWLKLAAIIKTKVVVDAETGCWVWPHAKSDRGYGQIWSPAEKKVIFTHRIMCATTHGDLPPKAMACHTCDNRACCNPDHLYIGDAKTNADDMVGRGRAYLQKNPDKQRAIAAAGGRAIGGRNLFAKGEYPSAKLTPDEVRRIRMDHRRARDIGAEYGVSRKTIESIRRREIWTKI